MSNESDSFDKYSSLDESSIPEPEIQTQEQQGELSNPGSPENNIQPNHLLDNPECINEILPQCSNIDVVSPFFSSPL